MNNSKIFITLFIFFSVMNLSIITSFAQTIPDIIEAKTVKIFAPVTGEKGKTFFYCSNKKKCSTEEVVREYYTNKGYKVMRAEHDFWIGMYTLAFLEEVRPEKGEKEREERLVVYDEEFYKNYNKNIRKKRQYIKNNNLQIFINSQMKKHEGYYLRELDEWEIEGYPNPVAYFKSPIVQEFLTRVDNITFSKVVYKIVEDPWNYRRGTPDYIIWNDNELIFIEVKREKEHMSENQILWAEFLIENKIPYNIVRVNPIKIKI